MLLQQDAASSLARCRHHRPQAFLLARPTMGGIPVAVAAAAVAVAVAAAGGGSVREAVGSTATLPIISTLWP